MSASTSSPEPLHVRVLPTTAFTASLFAQLLRLCDAAYGVPTKPYFDQLGNGAHLLGFSNGTLVSHLIWVTRWLAPQGSDPLRTAYVEMVATDPAVQRRGYASALLHEFPAYVSNYELAALCPATEGLYSRQGWRFWRGPLFARRDGALEATPEERVMIMQLPRTPVLDWDASLSVEWRPGEVW